MGLDKATIREGLRAVGIEEGDLVFFHSSFKSLGPVEGGPDTVIDGFLDAAGLATRDGVHTLKVRDRLPLQPYLVAAATVADVDPQGTVETWTPRLFLERANAWFEEQAGSGRWRST